MSTEKWRLFNGREIKGSFFFDVQFPIAEGPFFIYDMHLDRFNRLYMPSQHIVGPVYKPHVGLPRNARAAIKNRAIRYRGRGE